MTKRDDYVADATEPNFFFLYTWSACHLHSRLSHTGNQQLILVKNFATSKSCNPKQLLQIGYEASQGSRFNPEVATFALNACLSSLLVSPSPDYQTVAIVLRKIIYVNTICKGESDDDSIFEMYKQAYRIMVGLKEGEYPIEEAKWLATTAWNRAALPVKMGHVDLGKKWMSLGVELATKYPGMHGYRACMEEYIAGFEKFNGGDDGERSVAVS